MNDVRRTHSTGRRGNVGQFLDHLPTRFVVTSLVVVITVLFLTLFWLIRLETTLPIVRSPGESAVSAKLPDHPVLAPGYHSVDETDASMSGDWIIQEIGDARWLATEDPDSVIRAAFYGTDIYVLARVGPDAGRIYATIDEQPIDHFGQDERGTFAGLWAGEASNRSVLLASGLAHDEHIVEIRPGESGELAVAGFEIVAETPFQWAFMLGYLGMAGGLFLAIRQILLALSGKSSRAGAIRSDEPDRT